MPGTLVEWGTQRSINTGPLSENFTGEEKQGLKRSPKLSLSVQGTFDKGMPSTTPLSLSLHPPGPHHLILSPLLQWPSAWAAPPFPHLSTGSL